MALMNGYKCYFGVLYKIAQQFSDDILAPFNAIKIWWQ